MGRILSFDEFMEENSSLLLPHVYIEFYYGDGFKNELYEKYDSFERTQIVEKHGVFLGCELIAKKVLEWIKNSKSKIIKVPISNCLFTNYIKININDFVKEAGYSFTESDFNKNNKKFDTIVIYLNKNSIKLPPIMHELQHAYEDYQLRLKNLSLNIKAEKQEYFENENQKDFYNKFVGEILYYLSEFERNAFINTLKGELLDYKGVFLTVDDAFMFIKRTKVYTSYRQVFLYCEQIIKLTDNKKRKYFLESFEKLLHKRFVDFYKLKSWLKQKCNYCKKKINTTVVKIVHDFYENNMDGITPGDPMKLEDMEKDKELFEDFINGKISVEEIRKMKF